MDDVTAQLILLVGVVASIAQLAELCWRFLKKDSLTARSRRTRWLVVSGAVVCLIVGAVLLSTPRTAADFHKLSLEAYASRNFPKAIRLAKKAVERDPEHLAATLHLAALHALLGEMKPAEATFLRALKVDPTSVNARIGLGKVLQSEGRDQEALVHYKYARSTTTDVATRATLDQLIGSFERR